MAGHLSWTKFQDSDYTPPVRSFTAETGVDYFVNQVLAIEPSLQYQRTQTPGSTINGFHVSIGVKYFIF